MVLDFLQSSARMTSFSTMRLEVVQSINQFKKLQGENLYTEHVHDINVLSGDRNGRIVCSCCSLEVDFM